MRGLQGEDGTNTFWNNTVLGITRACSWLRCNIQRGRTRGEPQGQIREADRQASPPPGSHSKPSSGCRGRLVRQSANPCTDHGDTPLSALRAGTTRGKHRNALARAPLRPIPSEPSDRSLWNPPSDPLGTPSLNPFKASGRLSWKLQDRPARRVDDPSFWNNARINRAFVV